MRRRLFLASTLSGLAADWTQFRGPARTGISTETGLLKQWPKEGPKLLWQQPDIGDGYGTVAVTSKFIYAVSNHGLDDEFVQALSLKTGEPQWSAHLGGVGNPNQQPPYPMARSTPAIDGDKLYAFSSDGDLAALRADTGETRNLADENPAVLTRMLSLAEDARQDLGDSLTRRQGNGVRPPGKIP